MSDPKIFQYRLMESSRCVFPGAHPGQMVSSGQLFKRHTPLLAHPDPRRIDLRASVLNPFGTYKVRVYQQPSMIDVYLLADLSVSMAFTGQRHKPEFIRDLLLSVAASALKAGDNCGFIGCSQTVEKRWWLPASRRMGGIESLAKTIPASVFNKGCDGLLEAVKYLPQRRALVFIVSDFHFKLSRLQRIMHLLNRHDAVPLVLWDADEFESLPQWGLVKFQDMERHSTRTLLMRPALHRKITQGYAQRRIQLQSCFRGFGCEPLFPKGAYQAALLQEYFQRRAAS